ncbi:MAG: cytochrome c [Thermodesulfobacteriota bacterium]
MRKMIFVALFAAAAMFVGSQAMAAADGGKLFASKCAMCHGKAGEGSAMAPALKGSEFVKGDAAAVKATITNGRAGADKKYPKFSIAMPKFQFSAEELDAIVAQVKGL